MAEAGWSQKAVAEFVGVLALVLIGGGAIIATRGGDLLLIALAHGLILSVMVSATGPISGGHINPAVTLGVLVGRRISGGLAAVYVAAQILGAITGAAILLAVYPDPAVNMNLGGQAVAEGVTLGQAILVEAVLTFFLVFVVYATAVDPRGTFRAIAGFGIGLTVAADILMGGPLTGASMNPARSFGPALLSGFWEGHIVYWVGPLLGGLVAGLLYAFFLIPKEESA
jgi:MIP family channel proteins